MHSVTAWTAIHINMEMMIDGKSIRISAVIFVGGVWRAMAALPEHVQKAIALVKTVRLMPNTMENPKLYGD